MIRPSPAHLLVLPMAEPEQPSGIILDVKTVRSINPNIKAMVVKRGSPTPKYPMNEFVRNGQEIALLPRSSGTPIEIDGVVHRLVHVSDVICYYPTRDNLMPEGDDDADADV